MSTEHIRAEKMMIVELEVNEEEFKAMDKAFRNPDEGPLGEGWTSNELDSLDGQLGRKYPKFFDNTKDVEMARKREYGDHGRLGGGWA